MATLSQRFYPHTVEWDGTDPAGGDVRTCETVVPALNATSSCAWGSPANTITVDPYTAGRTTTGLDSSFGWAIDIAGADGMDGTAAARRFIPEGVWRFQGRLRASPVAALNPVVVGCNIYRVAAAPSTTRTLIFSANAPGVAPTTAGLDWGLDTASQSLILLEAGETIQYTATLTNSGQIGGVTIEFLLGDAILTGFDGYFDVPAPGIRTQYPRDLADTGPQPTDDLARIVTFPRALTDAGPVPTDDLVRAFTGARSLDDAGPAPTDDLTRAVTFPRALDDLGPTPTDDLARQFTANRALTDVGPASTDDLARAFTGARDLTDLGPQITDQLDRQVTYARLIEDDISGSTIIETHPIFGLFD